MNIKEFEQKCREHRRSVLAYAYTCAGDYNTAEDIVQEALTIAFEKRDNYFPEADFTSWLISIARNVWLRECDRRKMVKKHMPAIEKHAEILFSADNYKEDRWAEERTVLADCLKKLQKTEQDLIKRYFKGGVKYADLAKLLNKTVDWVKVTMYRSRKALHKCVQLALGRS